MRPADRTAGLARAISARVYYGWFVAIAAGAAEFGNAASSITVLTFFVIPMTDEFGWSRTEISGATSVGAILGAALAPFTGRMVDRVGSRMVLVVGGVAVAAACFYLAAAQTLVGFYVAFTIARTADQGLIKIGTTPVVTKWFRRYRGRAVSVVFFTGMLGVITMAPVVQLVIAAWGWRAAWVMLGVVMALVGVLPSALIVRRQPEDIGLRVDGASLYEAQGLPSADASVPGQASLDLDPRWRLGQILRTPAFWLLLVSLFVVSTASSGVVLHLMPYITEQGISSGSAVGIISVFTASGAVSTVVVGVLSDRTPPRLLMVVGYLLSASAMGMLIVTDTLPEAFLFAVLQGTAASGINVLAPILLASYYGRWAMGSIYGITRAAQVVGFALGALISGVVYDSTGSYRDAFTLFLVIAAASSLLVIIAKRPAPPDAGIV